ncbi:MAG: foldase [Gammaproteobacteria bacterium]|nr:MAG: foldase [Gammaproteobacteria bacterium]
MMNTFKIILTAALLISAQAWAKASDRSEVLVSVGGKAITAGDLEQAVTSSPFATQFNTLEENEQAGLRGDILKGIVATKLLFLEAKAQGIDKTERFAEALNDFRNGLYYRAYMDRMRSKVKIPAEKDAEIRKNFQGDADAMAAARASYKSEAYRQLRSYTILALRDKYHVKVFAERVKSVKDLSPDTVLVEGDGFKISYGDIVDEEQRKKGVTEGWLLDRLFQRTELLLVAKTAKQQNLDISDKLAGFVEERLPSMLVEIKEKEWVPDEKAMQDYFDQHPEIATTPTRWHVGQLVLADEATAKELRAAIDRGASLYFLAGHYSIDPYGRSKNGDMGWIKEGKGFPQIEKALHSMEDKQVSDVIKTPLGYHIVTVLERRPGENRPFAGMKDKVKQVMVRGKMGEYLKQLEKKFNVDWKILQPADNKTAKSGD